MIRAAKGETRPLIGFIFGENHKSPCFEQLFRLKPFFLINKMFEVRI